MMHGNKKGMIFATRSGENKLTSSRRKSDFFFKLRHLPIPSTPMFWTIPNSSTKTERNTYKS